MRRKNNIGNTDQSTSAPENIEGIPIKQKITTDFCIEQYQKASRVSLEKSSKLLREANLSTMHKNSRFKLKYIQQNNITIIEEDINMSSIRRPQ